MLQGPDLRALERASNSLAETARAIPGLVDVDTSLRVGKPEMSVRLDRPKAADLGVQVSDAADALRLLVGGDQVTTYNEGGEQYEVHLRAEDTDRGSEAAIAQADGARRPASAAWRSRTSRRSRTAKRRPTSGG